MNTWFEKEEDSLCEDLNAGRITQQEFDREMRDLRAAVRDAAREEAEAAYNHVMDNY